MSTNNIDISNKKVAIVLPIFNTEQYLSDCLDSIINQTHKNFIIFAIDDESTDGSPNILKSYSIKDCRIHPIRIKNSGVSSARNVALESIEKNGDFDYISFIDSDDKLHPDFLESHLTSLVENNADISICGYAKLYGDNITKHRRFLSLSCLAQKQFVLLIFSLKGFDKTSSSGGMIWKQIYKANILKDVRFSTEHNICEDELFNLKAATKAKKFIYIPKILYSYRQRENGTALTKNKEFSLQILRGRILCVQFAKSISTTLEAICLSAYIQSFVSIVKKKDILVDICTLNPATLAAYRQGYLSRKNFYLFILFCQHPTLAQIYRHFRSLFYNCKKASLNFLTSISIIK